MSGDPWYNTYICKILHGNVFERFIINARTDRYNIMCSIDAHDDKSRGGGYPLTSNSTTESLFSFDATIYFITCWKKPWNKICYNAVKCMFLLWKIVSENLSWNS